MPALSWSVVTIYSCLALLYVAGSRFVVRYYLLTRYIQPTVARVAIYGAGDAGARLSTVLSTTRAFDPVVFIDDNRSLHGRMVNGIKVYSPGRAAGADQGPQHRPHPACAAVADPAPPARDPERARAAWACTCRPCRNSSSS